MENGTIKSKKHFPSPNPHVRLTEIVYWSEGLKVKGMLAEPKELGNYSGILYLRGGIQSIGMVRPARIAQFAAQGFVVFAPYYRGNRGGEGRDEFAGADRWDAVHAVDVLKNYSNEKVHLLAFSRGGIMALWTAILRRDVTSLVTWAGVTDTVLTYKERPDMRRMMKRLYGGTPNTALGAYEERNPLMRIDESSAPMLIIHGLRDENVYPAQAYLLEEALELNGQQYETWYFPDYTHFFPPAANRKTVKAICQWMRVKES
ncbi:dipeptidyl aminopeptidase/acylaminoacyl peptidase [Planomicrobium stackebrandtii]|uniref:Dipeptidyl aminopeptidase/acylaminoacyl peptidase n=1 Tax=Planomicrobium stackebrandtii TaxID=253160 RepID=A0ABU0GYF7_9BACL|nr:prolyl oligopeptidase family serine peptidase [Planomicrobium stackebrandtii]MDQ0430395.1 dipeptidyl aminopeptidase/acylaminoacyl peptidase [Planomicrobium stackebrandtii]